MLYTISFGERKIVGHILLAKQRPSSGPCNDIVVSWNLKSFTVTHWGYNDEIFFWNFELIVFFCDTRFKFVLAKIFRNANIHKKLHISYKEGFLTVLRLKIIFKKIKQRNHNLTYLNVLKIIFLKMRLFSKDMEVLLNFANNLYTE